MELEQTQDSNAEIVEQDENEILRDLADLKNDDIQTLDIMPFATPIHNWNDLKDTVSFAETLLGMSTALRNHMTKYNRLIDTVAQLTRDWNSDISSLQVSLTGTTSIAKDANTKIESFRPRITSLETYRTDQRAWNGRTSVEIDDLWDSNSVRISEIGILNKKMADKDIEVSRIFVDNGNLWNSNAARISDISALNKRVDDKDIETKRLFAEIGNLWNSNSVRISEIGVLNKKMADKDVEVSRLFIDTGDLWESNAARISDISNLDKRINDIEVFDFGSVIDLTVLVIAINGVGSKVQTLIDLFNVTKVEPGTFTFFLQSSIKTQTDAITQALAMVDESLNDNFINYFDDSKNGKFWTAFKKFSDFQMAVFFGVFFETLDEKWEENWLDILETWNITNDLLLLSNQWLDLINSQLSSANNTLAIITQWLKQIYEKPQIPPIISNPEPEDGEGWFGKLIRRLLEEIVRGGFSLLETAIETLGGVIETAIQEAAAFYKVIADFLDSLLDKLIALIVPENLDFMSSGIDAISLKFNAKFDGFLSIATDITSMFKPIQKDIKAELSFDFMGAKFVPNFDALDPYVPKFRGVIALMLWFQTGWWAFRRFTGTGDVVNDS